MNPRIVQRSTIPCRTCGEAIEKRRKLDGDFKKRQPKYCSYRCWYAAEGPRLSAERHAQTGAEIRKADEVWKSINSGFCPKRMEEPDNSTGIGSAPRSAQALDEALQAVRELIAHPLAKRTQIVDGMAATLASLFQRLAGAPAQRLEPLELALQLRTHGG
jgi:hypothetical protein